MEDVTITSTYITLGQFLKYKNLISGGGRAKFFLMEHDVFVNDELDLRRGRKLYPGDRVEIDGIGSYRIVDEDADS
jgi:S4 domain protein YaaA